MNESNKEKQAIMKSSSQEKYPEVVMPKCEPLKILRNQKALVTGANSGIGKAVAIAWERQVRMWW